ncbi:MAG: hypothetical protein JXQ73_09690 [Phycisphaerae bacterium]|nr:hypothetical protein [Phycisphaerae bacterium]
MNSALYAARLILALNLVPCGQPVDREGRVLDARRVLPPRMTPEERCRQTQRRHVAKAERLREMIGQANGDEELGRLKHQLAQTLELTDGKGHEARHAYAEMLERHLGYSKWPEVAYRLGDLHTCIILPGTEPDRDKAMTYYEKALEAAPPGRLVAQQAHLRLGGIHYSRGERLKAREHYERAYRFDASQLTMGGDEEMSERERRDRLRGLQADCEIVREAALGKFVATYRDRSSPVATLTALDELERRCPGDERLLQMIEKERGMTLKRGAELIRGLDSVLSFPSDVSPRAPEAPE